MWVREAGHAEDIVLTVAADGSISAEAPSSNLVRTILTIIVIAVLGGVAYYFSRKPIPSPSMEKAHARS